MNAANASAQGLSGPALGGGAAPAPHLPDGLATAAPADKAAMVRAAFLGQADSCAGLGSPLTARLCRLCAERLGPEGAVGAAVLGWAGEPSSSGDSVPLRLMGGLHALVLGGADPVLAEAYAAAASLPDGHLWAVVSGALDRHPAHLLHWLQSAPQTNEVRRSAVLIAAGHWLAARFGLPLVLSELGASAGLNLLWDRWRLETPAGPLGPAGAPVVLAPEWRGAPPTAAVPEVAERAGADLNPLDPVADRLRLLSYIWADQSDRLARTRAALDVAAANRPPVARADAVDWLAERLATPRPGQLHLVCHTIAWQYFPAAAQARGEALLARHGARATPQAPLARLGMEADASGLPGAAMVLDLWPGALRIPLGRVDFHGRWIGWQAPAP